ncbi:glutaredoxin family protein [Haloplanus halophilus]|uniref:glutaredoxin family protein n=1 Tax=Haloplanus halophilus TaxID=2949993 RepID=UPI00203E9F39|nr:glutaredoxin family protein [Haloplanus sp. GDY1]
MSDTPAADSGETATVTVYTRADCHLCAEAIETVERVAASLGRPVDIDVVDVDTDPDLRERYGDRVPYVTVDGRPRFKYRVDADDLREILSE